MNNSSQLRQMMSLLRSDDGVEQLMKKPVYTNEFGSYSQAELLADVINILRMDAKRLGAMHGVDLSIEKIEPERMAWILGQMVQGNTEPMVGLFNSIEDLHHEIMRDALDDATFQTYLEFKESQLYTVQPGDAQATEPDAGAAPADPSSPAHPPEYGVPADMGLEEFQRQLDEIEADDGDEFADLDDAEGEEAPGDE